MFEVPAVVQTRARLLGAGRWLDELPRLVETLAEEWSLSIGEALSGATEALVLAVEGADGSPLVLKLLLPEAPDAPDAARHEITALRLAGGRGCARLERSDVERRAMLLERLGRPLRELGLPRDQREDVLVDTARQMWRPASGHGLPTGAEKGRWLMEAIERLWEELDRPCAREAVDHALAAAKRRIEAHDDGRAVLVHGDAHEANTLEAGNGFKLIDPDGLLAEPEYDVGVILRERESEGGPASFRARVHALAAHCDFDAPAIEDWATVERLSTGLVCRQLGLFSAADRLLATAEEAARTT